MMIVCVCVVFDSVFFFCSVFFTTKEVAHKTADGGTFKVKSEKSRKTQADDADDDDSGAMTTTIEPKKEKKKRSSISWFTCKRRPDQLSRPDRRMNMYFPVTLICGQFPTELVYYLSMSVAALLFFFTVKFSIHFYAFSS